jgi:hypothetical protein
MNGPLFAPLLAVYPILYIASRNPGQASAGTIGAAVLVALLTSTFLLVLIRPILHSWNRAALGVAVLLLLFFSYGPVHTALNDALFESMMTTVGRWDNPQGVAPHLHLILTTVWTAGAVLGLWAVRRLHAGAISPLVRGCNAMALVLLGFVVAPWVRTAQPGATTPSDLPRSGGRATSVIGYNPDIYVIVLDGYARQDVLAKYYRFDNSEFLNGLKQHGFTVSTDSRSNYYWTFLSLASILNMDYLDALAGGPVSQSSESLALFYDAVRRNAVGQFLKERGYATVHFQTTWGATLENPYADVQVPCHRSIFTNEFHRVLAEASWLKILQSRISADVAECYLSNLDGLARMGAKPGPKFVFAHFLPPHHPYIFDRAGNILRNANLSNQFEYQRRLWDDKTKYLNQLVYMNERIMEAVKQITATSARPPIIVILSDHGPFLERGVSLQERHRARFSTLLALLLPDAPPDLLPDSSSSVNLFRRLLNHYFEAGLQPRPDRYYYSEFRSPFDLHVVSLSAPGESTAAVK